MDILSLIGWGIWAWGAYEGWKTLTAKNNEWLNTKEPLNIVVKVALCVVLGYVFFLVKAIRIGWRLGCAMIGLG